MSPSLSTVAALGERVRASIQRAIVGKDEAIDQVLIALLAGGHVLVEDLPGTGKTTLCKALAASLGGSVSRIQFTPDLVPSDVLGVNVLDADRRGFEFQPGPIFANVVVADEINRATPRTQSALLEAMQEGQVSIDGVTSVLPPPFIVVATLNPVEMEGTFALPEAQLDRFMLRVALGYPTPEEESALLERYVQRTSPPALAPVTAPQEVLAAREAVGTVRVEKPARDYLLAVVRATREHERIALGASPRAALALQRSAQARAALAGRSFVLPDDVKALAGPALAHRIRVDAGSRLRGMDAGLAIAAILDTVPVPIEA